MAMPDNTNAPEPTGLLNLTDLIAEIRMGHSWIYDEIKAGRFPHPIKLGRASRWRRSDISKWLATPGWRSNATNDNTGKEG